MTYSEMDYEFKVVYDAIAGLEAPGFNAKQRSILLTMGQESILKKRLEPKGTLSGDTFEGSEKRRIEFGSLVKTSTISTSTSNSANLTNGVFFNLPVDCWLLVSETANITFTKDYKCYETGHTLSDVRVKPITHDSYSINKDNPFKKPYEDLVWRLNVSNSNNNGQTNVVELISDGNYSVSSYKIRYIAKPQPIIVDSVTIRGIAGPLSCQLDTMLHPEIVKEAAYLAVEITKDPVRYQTLLAESQKNVE